MADSLTDLSGSCASMEMAQVIVIPAKLDLQRFAV